MSGPGCRLCSSRWASVISSHSLERSTAWTNPARGLDFWGPTRIRRLRCASHARRAAGSVRWILRSGALHLWRLVLECTIGVRSFLYSCSLWLRLCPEPSLCRSLKLWGCDLNFIYLLSSESRNPTLEPKTLYPNPKPLETATPQPQIV